MKIIMVVLATLGLLCAVWLYICQPFSKSMAIAEACFAGGVLEMTQNGGPLGGVTVKCTIIFPGQQQDRT